jgi:hypothetical protein
MICFNRKFKWDWWDYIAYIRVVNFYYLHYNKTNRNDGFHIPPASLHRFVELIIFKTPLLALKQCKLATKFHEVNYAST